MTSDFCKNCGLPMQLGILACEGGIVQPGEVNPSLYCARCDLDVKLDSCLNCVDALSDDNPQLTCRYCGVEYCRSCPCEHREYVT